MDSNTQIVTRFAPSPTGLLHIGGARTALFNWAFARHHGGKFLLRIEDTDPIRSTKEAIKAILQGMNWLGLESDLDPVYQHKRRERHVEIAHLLLKTGKAYRCDCRAEELEAIRQKAKEKGDFPRYNGCCREKQEEDFLSNKPFVIRFKTARTGTSMLTDIVQGRVQIDNEQLDDFILLRSDVTPTYMLSVIVDDYDMNITHIIRGDDHLTNALRQKQVFDALGWVAPFYAHIPLIYGSDGKKLSKRHGALGIESYRDRGYLPEAMRNYLARLGWAHGNEEVFTTQQLIEWFNLDAIGKSPACFDINKLDYINACHIRQSTDMYLVKELIRRNSTAVKHQNILMKAMPFIKKRIKNVNELEDSVQFLLLSEPLKMDNKVTKMIDEKAQFLLSELLQDLKKIQEWSLESLENCVRDFIQRKEVKLGVIAPVVRASLTGRMNSLGIFDILFILGKEKSLIRISAQIK